MIIVLLTNSSIILIPLLTAIAVEGADGTSTPPALVVLHGTSTPPALVVLQSKVAIKCFSNLELVIGSVDWENMCLTIQAWCCKKKKGSTVLILIVGTYLGKAEHNTVQPHCRFRLGTYFFGDRPRADGRRGEVKQLQNWAPIFPWQLQNWAPIFPWRLMCEVVCIHSVEIEISASRNEFRIVNAWDVNICRVSSGSAWHWNAISWASVRLWSVQPSFRQNWHPHWSQTLTWWIRPFQSETRRTTRLQRTQFARTNNHWNAISQASVRLWQMHLSLRQKWYPHCSQTRTWWSVSFNFRPFESKRRRDSPHQRTQCASGREHEVDRFICCAWNFAGSESHFWLIIHIHFFEVLKRNSYIYRNQILTKWFVNILKD